MVKTKIHIQPPEKPKPGAFSQLESPTGADLQAIRDHLLVVMAWNSLHEQMHLDNESHSKSQEINKEIQQGQ